MKAVNRPRYGRDEEYYWPSFTDVMSSLVFVLFFFIIILYVKQVFSAKTWDLQLAEVSASLTLKQKELNLINIELEKKKQEMAGLEASLTLREEHISSLESQLAKDRNALYQKEQELSEVRSQLAEISVFRLSLLNDVKKSIEEELGSSDTLVTINDNADLVIESSLLFAKNSSDISESGRKMLRQFALAFGIILSKPSVRNSIDSIIISGYADADDTYQNNYDLSCKRAIAVITTMMNENPVLEKSYGSYFQASGFSEFRPLVEEVNDASKARNRRIQISINIKDTHIQDIINHYMNKRP